MRILFSLLLSAMLLASCSDNNNQTNTTSGTKPAAPRNVILLIGDGMGSNQVYAAMTVSTAPLAMAQMTYTAFVKTFSANRYITDSAAGGTAIACGQKTNNGMLGLNADTTILTSLLEHYQEHGYATGLVVTSPITHATPAAFYAKVASRNEYETIARQLVDADIDFFCGGGRRNFENRSDSVFLTDSLTERGYNIYYSIDSVESPTLLPCGILAADIDLPDARERGDYLPRATTLAIQSLHARAAGHGFFLMVEGSQIDYRCHGNDAEGAMTETLDFDQAVAAALKFAKEDGNTLVVVTADHETGGLTVIDGSHEAHTVDITFGNAGQAGTSSGHTGVMVPLFAYGPGAELFHGVIDNTLISSIIKSYDTNK